MIIINNTRNYHRISTEQEPLHFEMMDYVVAFFINKKGFYVKSQPKNYWTDQLKLTCIYTFNVSDILNGMYDIPLF